MFKVIKKIDWNGNKLSIETGKIAGKQMVQ